MSRKTAIHKMSTAGSRLGMNGYDLKTIMEIMGHKTATVALRYQYPTADHKMAAVKSLERLDTDFDTSMDHGLKLVMKAEA